MFKVNYRNTRTVCKVCSKLTIKTLEWRHWRRSGVFIIKFERVNDSGVLFSLLVLLIFSIVWYFLLSYFKNKKNHLLHFWYRRKSFIFLFPAQQWNSNLYYMLSIHSKFHQKLSLDFGWNLNEFVSPEKILKDLIFCLIREGNTGKN